MPQQLDYYNIEHPEQHTPECLEYAKRTLKESGRAFCIVECGDQRIPPGTGGRPPKAQTHA